jgi:hypothetical protein
MQNAYLSVFFHIDGVLTLIEGTEFTDASSLFPISLLLNPMRLERFTRCEMPELAHLLTTRLLEIRDRRATS